MGEINFIMGKECLYPHYVLIDCKRKLVRDQSLSGGELVTSSDKKKEIMVICSATKTHKYLQHICSRYLAFVVDRGLDQNQLSFDEVPIVKVFPDVFHDIPPEQ